MAKYKNIRLNEDVPTNNSFSGSIDDIVDGTTYVKTENNLTDALVTAIEGIPVVSDVAYDATSWNNNTDVPTKNAIRDKFESLTGGGLTQPQIMARSLGC